jgi:putative membrane protein
MSVSSLISVLHHALSGVCALFAARRRPGSHDGGSADLPNRRDLVASPGHEPSRRVAATVPTMEAREPDPPDEHRAETPAEAMDIRFSYANERTFLAWNRTALGLITAGLAITQLLPPFDFPVGRKLIGIPLIALGTVIPVWSLVQWRIDEREMRVGRSPRPSSLPWLVGIVVGGSALVAALLVIAASRS